MHVRQHYCQRTSKLSILASDVASHQHILTDVKFISPLIRTWKKYWLHRDCLALIRDSLLILSLLSLKLLLLFFPATKNQKIESQSHQIPAIFGRSRLELARALHENTNKPHERRFLWIARTQFLRRNRYCLSVGTRTKGKKEIKFTRTREQYMGSQLPRLCSD